MGVVGSVDGSLGHTVAFGIVDISDHRHATTKDRLRGTDRADAFVGVAEVFCGEGVLEGCFVLG